MDLFENPFYVLSASLDDDRARVMALAEEQSLSLDTRRCMEASLVLTNPSKRVGAEVAWLPGVNVKRVTELFSMLKHAPFDLLAIDRLPAMARVNLLTAALAQLPKYDVDIVSTWILEIARTFDLVDCAQLVQTINAQRSVSGFPQISDLGIVEQEIQVQCRHYCQVIKQTLDHLPSRDLVQTVNQVVKTAVGGEYPNFMPAPVLVVALVDLYEIEVQPFCNQEKRNIETLVEKLYTACDKQEPAAMVELMINMLERVSKNWLGVIRPIQLNACSQNFDDAQALWACTLFAPLLLKLHSQYKSQKFGSRIGFLQDEIAYFYKIFSKDLLSYV